MWYQVFIVEKYIETNFFVTAQKQFGSISNCQPETKKLCERLLRYNWGNCWDSADINAKQCKKMSAPWSELSLFA